jgi:tetratricopeptide (TPR) repeat protein
LPPGKIPVTFYIRFGLKNSIMALATGMLMGFMVGSMWPQSKESPVPLILGLAVGIISFIGYQFYAYNYYSGKRRGEFEYIYRQSLIDSRIKRFFDRLSHAPTIPIPKLLNRMENEPDPNRKFDIYMTVAWFAAREDRHQKAIEYLQEAAALKKDDLVASFRLGQSWERLGKGEEAIQAYEMALQDPWLDSQPLKEFVSSQIERVRNNGPQKGMPYHYLKHIRG